MLKITSRIIFVTIFLHLHQNNCQNIRTPPLPSLANEKPKKTAWGMDRQTDGRTDGHCDSMTDPAQRAESVKIQRSKTLVMCCLIAKQHKTR